MPAVATVPATVTVPAGGATSPSFTVSTQPVTSQTSVTIYASYGGVTKPATLTVNPIVKADLFIYSISLKDITGGPEPDTRNVFDIWVTVYNDINAPGPAAPSTLRVDRLDLTSGYTQSWEAGTPSLIPGAHAEVSVRVPGLTSGDSYRFTICADYYNVVPETNETNNCFPPYVINQQ